MSCEAFSHDVTTTILCKLFSSAMRVASCKPRYSKLVTSLPGSSLSTMETKFVKNFLAILKITDRIRYRTSSSPSVNFDLYLNPFHSLIFKTNNSAEGWRGSIKTRVEMSTDKFKNAKVRD